MFHREFLVISSASQAAVVLFDGRLTVWLILGASLDFQASEQTEALFLEVPHALL